MRANGIEWEIIGLFLYSYLLLYLYTRTGVDGAARLPFSWGIGRVIPPCSGVCGVTRSQNPGRGGASRGTAHRVDVFPVPPPTRATVVYTGRRGWGRTQPPFAPCTGARALCAVPSGCTRVCRPAGGKAGALRVINGVATQSRPRRH